MVERRNTNTTRTGKFFALFIDMVKYLPWLIFKKDSITVKMKR